MTDLKQWLATLGLGEYCETLMKQRVDLDVLTDLSEADLADLGVPLGDRKRMMRGIEALRREGPVTESPAIAGQEERDPGGLRSRLLDDKEELRQVTLLFADLVGSTRLSTSLDLESYRDTIRRYQVCCSDLIGGHFGFVAQFQGDGVVAYYGYPRAMEDDAERAVSTGLQIVREVPRLENPDRLTLGARVGVATGDVLISAFRSDQVTLKDAVLGDTPNLAARLQALAAPGQVVVSDRTRRLLGARFDCAPLEVQAIKGFDGPQTVWLVRGVKAETTRFSARRRGSMTQLVGRDEETEILRSRWDLAAAHEGQVVLISGEAGIGKSRLGEWLSDGLAGQPHYRLAYQCSPYHTGSPFYPVASQIARAAGFAEGDSDDERLDKLEHLLARSTTESGRLVPLFARLLSIGFEHRYGSLDEPASVMRERTSAALLEQLFGLAAERPLLMVFEDLHWIDPSTEELLDLLVGRIGQSRILLLCTYRAEYEAPWTGHAGVTQIWLSRLDRRRSLAMISRMAGEAELPADLVEQIVDRTEGVPLFIEELTRSVLERPKQANGTFATGVSLPSSLKELLTAKLDSLSSAREIVPICAAIGRSFSYRLLLAVSGLSDPDLGSIVEQLLHSQILLQRGEHPDATLTFRHALIQEAAYEALLQRRALSLHARIAEVLTDRFPEIAGTRPEVVAQHWSRAGRPLEARDRWRAAARLAIARSANVEACAHLEHALEENARLEESADRTSAEIEIREAMRTPLELCGWGSDRIERNLRRLYELREGEQDLEGMFSVLRASCLTHGLAGNVRQALEAAGRLEEVAEKTGDPVHGLVALHHLAMCAFLGGEFETAIPRFEREIESLTPELQAGVQRYYPADPAVVARLMQAWAMILSDRQDEADRRVAEARALIDGHDQPFTEIYGLAILACIHQIRGEAGETLAAAAAAYDLACENRMAYWEGWTQILRGWALVAANSDPEGVRTIREGLDRYRRTGARQLLPYARTLLADALRRTGQSTLALHELEALVSERPEVRYYERVTATLLADLHRENTSAVE